MRLCCSLALAVAAFAFQPPLPPNGSLEGRVIDAATGAGVAGARVTLTQIPIVMGINPGVGMLGNDFYDSSQMPATRTGQRPPVVLQADAEGKFQTALGPGRYQIRADRAGYVVVPSGITMLSLIPGENLKGIDLKLNRQAAVSGRVTDAEGQPMTMVRLQALKWSLWGGGGRRMLTPQASTMTNERGEYQLPGLSPGHYLLAATQTAAEPAKEIDGQRLGYVTLLAPGVSELASARELNLTPGTVIKDADVRLRRVPVFDVSGQVSGAGGAALVTLLPRESALQMAVSQQSATQSQRDGVFVLRDVAAGEYVLRANGLGLQGEMRGAGQTSLKVEAAVNGVRVTIEPSLTVKGRVRGEGDWAPEAVTLYLQPVSSFTGSPAARVDAEGRFSVSPVERGTYRVMAYGLPRGFYLKSVRQGDVTTPDRLDLRQAPADDIVVTLEDGTSEINGKVLTATEKPLGDVQVVAVNAAGEMVRSAITVIDGAYRLAELPPGEYRIFPVIDADLSDPATFERLVGEGAKVTLGAATRETKHLIVR